jgi:hypothetical protein
MANDPIPTTDQQVEQRPGQTAPVPLPAALQSSAEGVTQLGEHPALPAEFQGWNQLVAKQGQEPPGWHAMLTHDGSQSGDVPVAQMGAARETGHHVAIPMQAPAPDNRTGWVPLHNAMAALKAGFQHIGQYKQAMDDALGVVRDKRADIAAAAADAIARHTANYDLMPSEIQNDLKEMIGAGVGFFTGGLAGAGPTSGEVKATGKSVAAPLTSTVPPLGLGGEPIEPLEPAKPQQQIGQLIPKVNMHVPPERTTGAFDAAIKEGGAIPGGVQKGYPEIDLKDIVMFHDPATGSTLGLNPENVSPENVRAQMRNSRAQYLKAKPEQSEIVPPGHPLHIPDESEDLRIKR